MINIKITFPFDSTYDSIRLLKLCALYFDEINIKCPVVLFNDEDTDFYNQNIIEQIEPLRSSNIVNVYKEDIFCDIDNSGIDYILDRQDIFIYQNMNEGMDAPKELFDGITSEALSYLSSEYPEFAYNDHWMIFALYEHYQYLFQISTAYKSVLTGDSIISANKCVYSFFNLINNDFKTKRNHIQELISFNSVPIFIPNYDTLTFDEILEIRLKAHDELVALRYYLDGLSKKYYSDRINIEEINIFIDKHINSAVKQFESKVSNMRISFIQKVLSELKNPLSYTPMLTSFFTNIPEYISILLSLSLISANCGLEYAKGKKSIKMDPLYFSVELRKKI